jgi:hypothetical protein
MHAAQGISRPVVIELGNGPDRLPSVRRMTVLAGDIQIAVRAVSARRLLRVRSTHASGKRQQQNPD